MPFGFSELCFFVSLSTVVLSSLAIRGAGRKLGPSTSDTVSHFLP